MWIFNRIYRIYAVFFVMYSLIYSNFSVLYGQSGSIKKIGTVEFRLDNSDFEGYLYLQVMRVSETDFLALIIDNTIYFFDIKSSHFVKKIELPKNQNFANAYSFLAESFNKIYVYHIYTRELWLYENGKVKKKKNFASNLGLQQQSFAPMNKVADYLILNNFANPMEVNARIGFFVNTKNFIGDFRFDYPLKGKFMRDYQIFFGLHSYVFNSLDNLLVYSFSAESDIFVVPINKNNFHRYSAKSKFVDQVEPYLEKKSQNNIRKDYQFYASHASYENILWNSAKNSYYRFVKLPNFTADYMDWKRVRFKNEFSIIKINNKFEVIDEVIVNSLVYDFKQSFVSGGKIYILNALSSDTDLLCFDIFEY
ncbi:MAG: DUF4221 family protein [Bacteroidales bacterium]|nr:DUF4221 family protein [Bacteroidales bacterium]